MTHRPLDKEKLTKVRALMDGAKTEGEKAAARLAATKIAKASGMTLGAALVHLDRETTPAVRTINPFEELFNSPEMRAARQKREAERLTRCKVLLEQYGSEDAVFAPCELERALADACAPLVTRDPQDGYINGLDGWGSLGTRKNMPLTVQEAVSHAIPLPTTFASVWDELKYWDRRADERCAFVPHYEPWYWVRAREYILEDRIFALPARHLHEVRARLDWFKETWEGDRLYGDDVGRAISRIQSDLDNVIGIDSPAEVRS